MVESQWPALVNSPGLAAFIPDRWRSRMKPTSISATMANTVSTILPTGPLVETSGSSTRRFALALKLMDQVGDIACAVAEAVKLDHHQGVTRTDEIENDG